MPGIRACDVVSKLFNGIKSMCVKILTYVRAERGGRDRLELKDLYHVPMASQFMHRWRNKRGKMMLRRISFKIFSREKNENYLTCCIRMIWYYVVNRRKASDDKMYHRSPERRR